MKYRTLGKTGLKVSEIGMGTWQIAGKPWGWDKPDETESTRALYKFLELGGNFIDTAWVYGRHSENKELGRHSSEELIGKFLKESGRRDKVIIASKIPGQNMKWPARIKVPISKVFPKSHIIETVNDSLRNLKIDSIDLMQFHVWQDDFVKEDEWKEVVTKLTKEGKVKYWGISVNDYQPSNCIKTLDTGLISTIQFIFNIFHQKPTEKLFPYAKENNIGLIARVPLDEGGLTGRIREKAGYEENEIQNFYFFGERNKQLVERVKELNKLLGPEAKDIVQLALKYILSFDEVSSVIPGMRKVKYIEKNISVSDGKKLSQKLLNELKSHSWERNFYYPKVDYDPAMKATNYLEI